MGALTITKDLKVTAFIFYITSPKHLEPTRELNLADLEKQAEQEGLVSKVFIDTPSEIHRCMLEFRLSAVDYMQMEMGKKIPPFCEFWFVGPGDSKYHRSLIKYAHQEGIPVRDHLSVMSPLKEAIASIQRQPEFQSADSIRF